MNNQRHPLATLGYLILGLLVLVAVVQILGGLLRVISWFASALISLALLVVVGYVVYLLIRAAYRSLSQ